MSKYRVRLTVEKFYDETSHAFCHPSCEKKEGWDLIASSGATVVARDFVMAFPLINEEIMKQWPKVQEFAGLADKEVDYPEW